MKLSRARGDDHLLDLDDVERRLKPFGRRYLGVRPIPLHSLVGTDSRASSFTRDFRPLHAFSRERLRSLEMAFADGAFPPIVTVKLGETYFVMDGHHRTALARRSGPRTTSSCSKTSRCTVTTGCENSDGCSKTRRSRTTGTTRSGWRRRR